MLTTERQELRHDPLGIEDPYKPSNQERIPRQPQPGEQVQINFQAHPGATRAWVELHSPHGRQSLEALPLSKDTWMVQLEPVVAGPYSYSVNCEEPAGRHASTPFEFEVGTWHEVASISDVKVSGNSIELLLESDSGQFALLQLSVAAAGVLNLRLESGRHAQAGTGQHSSQELQVSQGAGRLTLNAAGLEAETDLQQLVLRCRAAGHGDWQVELPLNFRWLTLADGQVSAFQLPFQYDPDDTLYGLGERFGPADLRGRRLDVRVYEEYKEQGDRTYLPVPFFVSNRSWGLWLDEEEPSIFDFSTGSARIEVGVRPAVSRELSLNILVADSPYGVTSLFTGLTGAIAVPPRWVFGPWMSANTWNSQDLAERAINRTLDEGVPASVLVLEAWSDEATFYIFNDAEYDPQAGDHQPRLADFRFTGRWPDPKGLVDHCHANGIKVLLWQIPVMKKLSETHKQHDTDEAFMLQQQFGIRNADGSAYRNKGWWFPEALVVDFSNPAERDWWFSKRQYLFDELGIDGMKTDGGEHLWGSDLRAHDGSRGNSLVNTYARSYSQAYYDFVQRSTGNDGIVFSRAGYTGAQTSPAHWAGDENSTWAAYKASILAGLSAGLSGISIWGWDIGGFSGEVPTTELYLRSTAMACLCPVMQYHSEPHGGADNRERSPWNIAERQDDPQALQVYREFAQLRMRLLDYIHAEAVVLSQAGLPLMRSLALAFPAEHERLRADPWSYLFGRDLLVSPVVEKSAQLRKVLLPQGDWLDAWTGSPVRGGSSIHVPVPLDRIPVFIRAESPRAAELMAAFRPG